MKCTICDRLMVSLYINERQSSSKTKKPIGKICLNCGGVNSPTEYFKELKQKITKEEEGKRKKPLHIKSENHQCSNCKSKRFTKRKFNKPTWTKYPNSDGSQNWQLNFPYIRWTCKRCSSTITQSMSMPYPLPKKYRIPPKN